MGVVNTDSPVDSEQLNKAVAAILKYISGEHRKHNELFDSTEYLYLVLGLARLPRSRKDKPRRMYALCRPPKLQGVPRVLDRCSG